MSEDPPTQDPVPREQELLVVRCQLGEREAFDELVARWHPALWGYVQATVRDSALAEEVLQDSWLRILRGIGGLQDAGRLRAWLFAIVRRALVDRRREFSAQPRAQDMGEEPVEDRAPIEAFEREDRDRLDEALGRLSPPDRETVVLFHLQELDLRQVAELLGVPEGTVKSRLHRARGILRQRLQSTRGDLP